MRIVKNFKGFLESRDKIEKFFGYLDIWLYFYNISLLKCGVIYLFILGINKGFNKKFESTIAVICSVFKRFINLGD